MRLFCRIGIAPCLAAVLLGGGLLCGLFGGGVVYGRSAGEDRGRWVLQPELEPLARGLLGPPPQSKQLPGGWVLQSISIRAYVIRYRFERPGGRLQVVLSAPGSATVHRSRNFSIALHSDPGVLSETERAALLQTVVRRLQRHDTGPSPWKRTRRTTVSTYPDRADPRRSPAWYDLRHPVRLLQLCVLLVLLGLGWRARWFVRRLREVDRTDGVLLATLSSLGLGLRLLTGSRIPGWVNNHGYELLNELLVMPRLGSDPHGSTSNAVHGLVLTVLPAREWVIVATQQCLSVALIPLVYLVGRAWLEDRRWALWAAVVAAGLPVLVYFSGTEVRNVSGAFFLLATLAALGWSIRDPHPVPRFVAALLAVLTTQAYPTLMVVPLVLLLFVLTAPGGRRLLHQRWSWAAAAVGLVLFTFGAYGVVAQLVSGEDLHGPRYLSTLWQFPRVVQPTWSFDNRSCNVWLNPHFTPPVFWLCALGAVVAALARRAPRAAMGGLVASALLLSLVGMVGGRMNTARIQLPAAPLYALLAGAGLGLLQARMASLLQRLTEGRAGLRCLGGRGPVVAAALLVTLVVGSLLIWPGPLVLRGAPQRQHRLIVEGLARVDPRCRILHPSDTTTPIGRLPTYLQGGHGKRYGWSSVAKVDVRAALLRGECLIYFRPVDCYERTHTPTAPMDSRGLVQACSAVEQRLTLRPLYTRRLPAIVDCEQSYSRGRLSVGFFVIEACSPDGAR